jgi:hypothetical protein
MLERRFLAALLVAIGSMKLAACSGEAARSAQISPTQRSSVGTSSSKPASEASFVARYTHPSRKDAPREAFLSRYNNPEEGISLRYPRNYSLEEGDLEEHSYFLKRQEDLDSEQPGAMLAATILIPEDGYPNTSFEHGSLQLVINEGGTETSCRDASLMNSGAVTPKTTMFQGVAFWWSERESVTAGTKVLERAYAGYSLGTCYEFLLTVAAEEAPDPDGFKKPADMSKIMKHLEKIVSSTQIFAKSATSSLEDSAELPDRL